MNIKPVAYRQYYTTDDSANMRAELWETGTLAAIPEGADPLYPQSAIDALTSEVEALRKLCLEAVGRVSVTPDGGDLHDRLIAASMKGEG